MLKKELSQVCRVELIKGCLYEQPIMSLAEHRIYLVDSAPPCGMPRTITMVSPSPQLIAGRVDVEFSDTLYCGFTLFYDIMLE